MEDLVRVEPDIDLDAERNGTFLLRGEVYAIRRVSPHRYAEELRKLDEVEKGSETTLEDIWDGQLDFIESTLYATPDEGFAGVEEFKKLRNLEYDGLEVRDVRPLMRFIQEVLTGRPTPRPEDSSPGPGSSEDSSKDESGAPEVVRPT